MDLGTFGIWRHLDGVTPELGQEVERAGFGTLWIGANPPGDLKQPEEVLAATDRLIVATGIVNMWTADAAEVADSYHRVAGRFPGRFLLGLGIGHPETDQEYAHPYRTMTGYLDALDRAQVPRSARILAALGPRVLDLAAARTWGAFPYLTTPEHTLQARRRLGAGPLIATEQMVVLDSDVERARAVGRAKIADDYLGLSNYLANLGRLGWTAADLEPPGSDALIDALVAHGNPRTVANGLTAHLTAGADHTCAQLLVSNDTDYLPALHTLSQALKTH